MSVIKLGGLSLQLERPLSEMIIHGPTYVNMLVPAPGGKNALVENYMVHVS